MKERIGVYICHCGGNISDYVDVEEICKLVELENGVIVSKDVMFACADSNQKEMIQDIQDKNLDAIVVASCSPKLHLHTFRSVAERAGINKFNYVQVNVREQCSWAHSDLPDEASRKATGLIRAGIRRVAQSEALDSINIEAHRAVLIIGAGVAGMRAAIDLARNGNHVYLIEKEYFVGGRTAQNEHIFGTNQRGKDLITRLYQEINTLPNITLFTGSKLEKISGSVGNFQAEITIQPRYVIPNYDKNLIKTAIDECKAETENIFDFGFSRSKAIAKIYPEALPDIPVINRELIEHDAEFLRKFKSCIDINQQPEQLILSVGSVLVTSGFDNYQPKEGEFGYQTSKQIITLPELKRLMEINPEKLIVNQKEIHKITFIYCVGNRQLKGESKYCSRTCCASTIHTSLEINKKYKEIKAFHLFRDIRTYGKQEVMYDQSCKQGDIYLKYDEKEPPVVEQRDNQLIVKIKDLLSAKKEFEFETDLVVLVTGMVSRSDSKDIAGKLKIPIGNDNFFNEIHPKLKPVETVMKGILIGGCCQGPKNISESVQSALSGAAKINALIKSGTIALDPIVASVNLDVCVWCGKCADVCDYGSVKQVNFQGKTIAEIEKSACAGCGICASFCKSDAIEMAQYTNREIEAMIDGFSEDVNLEAKPEKEETSENKATVKMKEYPTLWKKIERILQEKPKTIPEIAQEASVPAEEITYNIMTMNRYGVVIPDGLDDNDTYFYYKLKTN